MATKKEELTLRDKFAMSALSALCGGSWNGTPTNMICRNQYDVDTKIAIASYKIADKMLEIRNLSNEELQNYDF